MIYQDEDFLQLSGLQHFKFCRRQWALIHVEKQWTENYRTTDGAIMHENAHDGSFTESRGDLVITRDMRVFSRTLGVSGACDVLEFRRGETGIPLKGREGLWQPYPVEYKCGKPKEGTEDTLQLCGQAMCLEEMLCCDPARRALLRRAAAAHRGRLYAGAAAGGNGSSVGDARPLPARPHAEGKADKGLQRLLAERIVSAKADEKQVRFRVSARRNGGRAMRQLLNTLFVTSEDIYLSLDGENVVGSALYFYAPALSQGTWINANCTYRQTIGCHRFYI